MRGRLADLTGIRFGRLVVQSMTRDSAGRVRWVCKCDCGGRVEARTDTLSEGRSTSCGCKRHDSTYKHGMTGTRALHDWSVMKQRCENPKDKDYKNYGGRGIKVCERWQDFRNFLADMGERPAGKTIDRIDNDKGYEPGNCRWTTHEEQGRNRRTTKLTESDVAEIRSLRESGEIERSIAERFGVSKATINDIINGRTWRGVG